MNVMAHLPASQRRHAFQTCQNDFYANQEAQKKQDQVNMDYLKRSILTLEASEVLHNGGTEVSDGAALDGEMGKAILQCVLMKREPIDISAMLGCTQYIAYRVRNLVVEEMIRSSIAKEDDNIAASMDMDPAVVARIRLGIYQAEPQPQEVKKAVDQEVKVTVEKQEPAEENLRQLWIDEHHNNPFPLAQRPLQPPPMVMQPQLSHPNMVSSMDTGRVKCEICSKEMGSRKSLLRHYKLHSGERPYECPHCKQRFIQKYNCKMHIARHERDRLRQQQEDHLAHQIATGQIPPGFVHIMYF